MNSIKDLTPQQLRLAADIQEKILGLQRELEQLLEPGSPTRAGVRTARRKLSPEGLANIRAGARRRWAKARHVNGAGPVAHRRKMSPAGRARISARLKERWAAAKRAGRSAL
jgi:hypothetical protein